MGEQSEKGEGRGTNLRHPFRRDKRPGLNGGQPRLGQALNEVELGSQRDRLLLVLEAIAGPDLDELDVAVRRGALLVGCS